MQRNCGVLAYDKLVGELNGRANEISMNTLAKLAQDNGFILYPLRVPIESMTDVPLPCVVYTQHHFEFMSDLAELAPVCMSRKFIYILSHELVNPDWVLDEHTAKTIKGADIGQMLTPPKGKSPWEAMTSGSTGGWAGFAGPSTPTNPQDPKGWGWVGPALTTAAGAIPGFGPLISAGMGAAGSMGGGTGFQGSDKGWGNLGSTAMGALGGWGAGGLGKGLASGIGAMMSPTATLGSGNGAMSFLNAAGTGPAKGLSAFGQGFGQGVKNYVSPITNAFGNLMGLQNTGAIGQMNTYANPLATLGAAGSANNILSPGGGAAGAGTAGGGGGGLGLDLSLGGMLDLGKQLFSLGQGSGNQFEMELAMMPEFQRPPELDQYAAQIGQAKTELGQMGRDELARVLQTPIGQIVPDDNAYMDAMMRRVDEAATARKQAVTSNYNSIGRANSSEHMQELGKIDKELAVAKQDMAAVIANEKIKMEMDYRLSALSGALGIDQQAAAELAGLTNLSVQEAALKFGLQAAQVMQLRQMSMLQNMQQSLSAQQAGYAQDLQNLQGQQDKDLLGQQGEIWKQIVNLQLNKTGV
jgi:hypothetical protein